MNSETVSAIGIMACGLLMALGAKSFCRKTRNVPTMQKLGACLAIAGLILLVLP